MTLNFAQSPTEKAHREYLRHIDEMALQHMRGSSHTQRDTTFRGELINSPRRPRIRQMIAERGWKQSAAGGLPVVDLFEGVIGAGEAGIGQVALLHHIVHLANIRLGNLLEIGTV